MLKGDLVVNKNLLLAPEAVIHFGSGISYEPSEDDKMNKFSISLQQVIDEGILINEIKPIAEKIISYLYNRWKSAYDYVNSKDSLDITTYVLS
jgi:hypothetical protein